MLVSLIAPLQAILFAAGNEGMTTEEIAHVLQLSRDETLAVCRDLQTYLDTENSGIMLAELAGAWQLCTRPEHVEYLRRMATVPEPSTISQAALETLAIIGYKQPITRMDVEAIRGVQSDRAIHTLISRSLIVEVGRADAPGRPILYGTTSEFLASFGLRNLQDLPPLPPLPEVTNDELSLFQLTETMPKD